MAGYRYLLDTNIVSATIKQPQGSVARRILAMDETDYCTSIIVACESRYGALKKGSPSLSAKVEGLLENIDILPLDTGADHYYAALRVALERIGQPIGHNDLFIAAHAISLGLTLVTDNVREFSRVPGLALENWLG